MSTYSARLGDVDFRVIFMDKIGELFKSEDNSDVILKVSNTRFHCHKLLLATQCEYFRAMFFGGMAESKTEIAEIDLPETPEIAFGAILHFIYTGRIKLTDFKTDVLLDILHLTDLYGFVDFQSRLCKFLISILDPENSIPIRDAAIKYSLDELLEECEKFIDRKAACVLKSKTFLTLTREEIIELMKRYAFRLSELAIFQAVCYWLDNNTEECPKQLVNTVVRLPLIDRKGLLCIVWPTKYVSDFAIIKALQTQLNECEDSEQYVESFHNGVLVPEKNIATLKYNSGVINGGPDYQLFDSTESGCPVIRRSVPLVQNNSNPPTIRLGKPGIINTIKLSQASKGSVYTSINNKDYIFLTKFQSETVKHFPSVVTQYIKIIEDNGTYEYKTFFQCYHTVSAP